MKANATQAQPPERPGLADFERVFRVHYADVVAFAIRRIGRDGAEDVAAEVFAVAWRKRDVLPQPSLPWLYAVARRVIANHRRGASRWTRLVERLGAATARDAPDPGDRLGDWEALAEAFAKLHEGDREVLRLAAWEGLAAREAAQVLGCSATAFGVRLHRARGRLLRHLDAGDPFSAPPPTNECAPAQEAR